MSYIGNTSTTQAFTPAVDFFNGNGSTTAFTLSRPVASVAQVQAVISNVPQNPGTAYTVSGNTITFTSAPPSGTQNIYVYYTSPITQVIAPGQGTVTTTSLSQGGPSWDTSGNVTLTGNIRLNNGTADGAQVSLASSGYSDWNIDNYSGNFRWYYNASEYMRLDASGNLGIGSTSPSFYQGSGLLIQRSGYATVRLNDSAGTSSELKYADSLGLVLETVNNRPIVFSVNASERARIDTSGNLLVGKTDSTNSTPGVQIYNSSGSTVGRINCIKTASGSASALANYYSGTYVGGVDYSNTATSLVTSSDIRLKKDIVDAGSASSKVEQIRIVSHGWKHDDEVVEFGVVAQELNLVAPQAVVAGDNGEEIEKTWGVDYSKLVPMLIKAHQEQQAIIETLTNRITALENK